MRDRIDQAELDFDTKGERFNICPDHPVKSLFDSADDIPDLEPEVMKRPGKWMARPGTKFEVYRLESSDER